MIARPQSAPLGAWAFGLLGIIPFWSLPLAVLLAPGWIGPAASIEAVYAALILSFLGGARWGLALGRPSPKPAVIGLTMTPTLAGLAILVLMHGQVRSQLLGLAAALIFSWLWDATSADLPPWYGPLRTWLTLGAVGGLILSAFELGW